MSKKGQGVELGRGYVSLAISTRGLGREVATEFGAITKAADSTASKAGATLKRGIGAGVKQAATEAAAAAKKAGEAQVTASKQARDALAGEEAAARKVTIAKKAHADAVAKYGEGSLQALRTADRLATAELKYADAQVRSKAAADNNAKATREATAAKDAADQATKRYERSLSGLGQRLRAGITSPFTKLAASADKDGTQASSRFGRALKAGTNALGRTLKPFTGLNNTALSAGKEAAAKLGAGLKSGLGKVGGLLKGGLAGMGAGAALSIGGAMGAGWGRFTALEDARAKLGALAATAPHVESVMDSALKSVKGTSHGMAEAATTAASLAASGIKPGKEMTSWLSTAANSASLAGMSMEEMGSIFGKVAANGKVDGEVLAQLADRGVPALQFLADELGVTASEARKMASEGKISASTFEKAMRKGAGGAADALGKTTTGSIKNFGAAVGRLGEKVISAFAGEGGIAGFFQGLTDRVDGLTKLVEPAVQRIQDALGPLIDRVKEFFSGGGLSEDHPVMGVLANLQKGFDGVREKITEFVAKIRPVVIQIVETIQKKWGDLQPRVQSIWDGIKGAVSSAMELVQAVIKRITDTVQWIWTNFGSNIMRQIEIVMDTVTGVIDGAMKVIGGIFDTITGLLTGDWSKMSAGLTKITDGLATSLGSIFRGLVGTLGNIWDGIRKVFATPVNWVISNVINPLIDGVNKVAEVFGAKWRAPRMKLMATPSSSTSSGGGARGSAQAYADGGRVGGFSPHPKADNIVALMTADEEVIRVKAARRLRREHPGLMEYMNRTGTVPPQYEPHGYAGGGRIVPNARQGFRNYNPTFLAAIQAWARATGRTWSMTGNGGARTFADQLRAWNLYQSGRGPLAANPYRGGPHMVPGRAMDLSPRPGENPAARALLGRYGLGLTVRGEPWHVGWTGGKLPGGVTSGPGGGFDPFGALIGLASKSINVAEPFKSIFGGLPGKLLQLGRSALGFDSGGFLPPGIHTVVNATGRPEPVLTTKQWDRIQQTPLDPAALAQAVRHGLDGARLDIDNGRLFFDAHFDRRRTADQRRERAYTG